jgi:hypothetical protein
MTVATTYKKITKADRLLAEAGAELVSARDEAITASGARGTRVAPPAEVGLHTVGDAITIVSAARAALADRRLIRLGAVL